jgi:putative ATP-dependent endonuclease of the OLD family
LKIRKLVLKNVLSYKQRTEFIFDKRINILIGPNGGGKSNLQRILALVLSKYFIHQYEFKRNDQEVKIEVFDPWTRRVLERSLAKYVGDLSDQEIAIELVPERSDVDNIKAIGTNLARFNEQLSFWESPHQSYTPLAHADDIAVSPSFTYEIRNLTLKEPTLDTPAWAFKEYLHTFFIFMRLSSKLPDVTLSSPVFFFFSERTFNKNIEIQTSQLTDQSYFQGYRSAYQAAMGENTNLLQWGAQHFVRLYRKAVNRAAEKRGAMTEDFFSVEPDVQLLNRYMRQLGYKWTFLTDEDSVSYAFSLLKDETWLTADKFSSGEREIVHFLLAMFALNVKDGLVLIDEPELHLHPRWQRIFLGLFRDLAPEKNNQFIISTHSPVFVSPDTINNITRVYKPLREGSTKVALRDIELPQMKNLVRMINSQNNERIFFADKVVLVEGISDRLVLASLLDGASSRFANNEAIEIVEVGGKNNFADYRSLLKALMTRSFIVADRDYLSLVGSEAVRSLFVADPQKLWDVLIKDKKSTDATAMVAMLNQAIDTADVKDLAAFWAYFTGRQQRLKTSLSEPEQRSLESDLDRLRLDDIHVLRNGEIEDYLPPGVADVKSIVTMITNRNWINDVPDESRRLELGRIACTILDVPAGDWNLFESELRKRRVAFPMPVSDR